MRLRDGITFKDSMRMLNEVWHKVRRPKVDPTLLGGALHFDEIEQHWLKVNDHEVQDFSVCWLFCYGNSGGSYAGFEPEIPVLWNRLFVIPYDVFVYFQTAMDDGMVIDPPEERYLHKRRNKFYDKMADFTFY